MYRHILLAVDGSAASRHVAEHAYELASQLRARVTVLHVLDDIAVPFVQYGMEPYVDVEAMSPEIAEAQRAAGERLVAGVRGSAPEGLEVEGVVVESLGRRIGEVVADEADRRDADLIILGTHGTRGLSRVFLGSVADSVVRSATVPVTLVRHHEHAADEDTVG